MLLKNVLSGLGLGVYRYPGGSIGNYWDWEHDVLFPAAAAANPFYATVTNLSAKFPPHSFGAAAFDAVLKSGLTTNPKTMLTLDVSTVGPAGGGVDTTVPAKVVAALGTERATRFEIGNEVYDPRQGPPPNGYSTAQDYLRDTAGLVAAVRNVGGRAGVVVGPCPMFWTVEGKCWGYPNGRYHQWAKNISSACNATACPFDAIIAHNYVVDVSIISEYRSSAENMLSVFLAVPQVTMDNAAAAMQRDYPPNIKLWVTEYNTFYPDVWHGKSDATNTAAAAFLNSTENSGAHAVQVAAAIIAAMGHGDVVEVMNYHSFAEGASPAFFGPAGTGDGQPGFGIAAFNDTGAYISPVAQMLSMFAFWLRHPGCSMASLVQPAGSPALNVTLAAVNLGGSSLPCIQAAVVCYGAGSSGGKVLALNRCPVSAPVLLPASACFNAQRAAAAWKSVHVYNATTGPPGRTWAKASGPLPWVALAPDVYPGGEGDTVLSRPFALSVIEL